MTSEFHVKYHLKNPKRFIYNSFKYKKKLKKYEMFMKGESHNRKIRELRRTQRIGKIGESCRNGRIGEFYITIHMLLLEVIFSDLPHETE